jgi:two-component sensor histidine kinase
LFRSFGVNPEVIKLRLNMGDVLLSVDTAIPCGLLVNKLVSNSLKYGFPTGKPGEIRIDLRSEPEPRFRLIVSDNGLGLPENLDFRSSPSFGLRLVNKLADQLEGTLKVDRNDGTTFMIEFAELKYRERR